MPERDDLVPFSMDHKDRAADFPDFPDVIEFVEREERDPRHHPEDRDEGALQDEPGDGPAGRQIDAGTSAERSSVDDDPLRTDPGLPDEMVIDGVDVGAGGLLRGTSGAGSVAPVVVGDDGKAPFPILGEPPRMSPRSSALP